MSPGKKFACSPAVFQLCMDCDIITGKMSQEHLKVVLRRLQKHGIHVKLPKCYFLECCINAECIDVNHRRQPAPNIHTYGRRQINVPVEAP